jgi:predicted amidohydrolase
MVMAKKKTPKKPIVALAAINYFDIHKTHNLVKVLRFIKRAKKRKADIICFPESCLKKTGCINLDDSMLKKIKENCKKNSIWCIINENILLNKKPYNVSVLIDRKGRIRGTYEKIHLYGDKTLQGDKVKVFNTDFGKIGIIICWDLAFPGLLGRMRKLGADIVFCPSQWHYDGPNHNKLNKKREIKILRSLVLSRAFENVFLNRYKKEWNNSYSQVYFSLILPKADK